MTNLQQDCRIYHVTSGIVSDPDALALLSQLTHVSFGLHISRLHYSSVISRVTRTIEMPNNFRPQFVLDSTESDMAALFCRCRIESEAVLCFQEDNEFRG